MRKLFVVALMAFNCAATSFGDVTISNVKAEPISPWNKVYLQCDISGDASDYAAGCFFYVAASNRTTGAIIRAETLNGDLAFALGRHKIIWDLEADGANVDGENLSFIISYTCAPMYLVVDLAGGHSATSYQVTSLSSAPSGGWTDDFKTEKLVLRRIEPGTFIQGNDQNDESHRVTLSEAFYIGVFEITQRQWELIMGTRPSYFSNDSYYALRPVEQVSYDMIRGMFAGSGWPTTSKVDKSSFLGALRAKTGYSFDLPTKSQWEYACRAGTTNEYNNGTCNTDVGRGCSNMNKLGRYEHNGGGGYTASCTTSMGTAKVGSYLPNAWGLYDMHGNVREWNLDWAGTLLYGNNPVGESSGNARLGSGGGWHDPAGFCLSYSTHSLSPSYAYFYYGFRVAVQLY